MTVFKVGDKVVLTKKGIEKYGNVNYKANRVYIVEMSAYGKEGPCVYNGSRRGWIYKGLGLYEYFKIASVIQIGGE